MGVERLHSAGGTTPTPAGPSLKGEGRFWHGRLRLYFSTSRHECSGTSPIGRLALCRTSAWRSAATTTGPTPLPLLPAEPVTAMVVTMNLMV